MLKGKSLVTLLILLCGMHLPALGSMELVDVLEEGRAKIGLVDGAPTDPLLIEVLSPPAGGVGMTEEVVAGLEEDGRPLLPVTSVPRSQEYGCCAMMRSPECCSCLVGHGIIAALFGLTYLVCSFVS